MTGIPEIPTIEENLQPSEQIQKTDTSQAEVVERGDNSSGGITSFQEELSKIEKSFHDKGIQKTSLEEGVVHEEVLPFRKGLGIGYDSEEIKVKVQKGGNWRDGEEWIRMKAEGPINQV